MSNTNGSNPDFNLQDFDYDPVAAGRPSTIGLLQYNNYEKSTEAYNEKSGKPSVPQWVMTFEDGLRQDFEDPTLPRTLYNRVNIGYWTYKDQDGNDLDEPKLVPHKFWNATPVLFAKDITERAKVNLSPRDPASQEFLEGWFRLEQYQYGEEPYIKKMWVPVEYLGKNIPDEVTQRRTKQAEEAAANF